MSTKEKPYCMNCGNSSHCDKQLTRKEIETVGNKIIHEWIMEVCRHCRCSTCEAE